MEAAFEVRVLGFLQPYNQKIILGVRYHIQHISGTDPTGADTDAWTGKFHLGALASAMENL